MSTEKNRIKIEEVLGSLDGIRRAKAPAFFYTRLMARMENEQEVAGGVIGRWLTRPALTLSLATVILLLNIAVILQSWKQDASSTNMAESAQIAVADYPMATYPVYDENPVEP
jgi:hypothetical protein